jgi:hypothetical protein
MDTSTRSKTFTLETLSEPPTNDFRETPIKSVIPDTSGCSLILWAVGMFCQVVRIVLISGYETNSLGKQGGNIRCITSYPPR